MQDYTPATSQHIPAPDVSWTPRLHRILQPSALLAEEYVEFFKHLMDANFLIRVKQVNACGICLMVWMLRRPPAIDVAGLWKVMSLLRLLMSIKPLRVAGVKM